MALGLGMRRTARLWDDRPAWARAQRRAMATDVGWSRPAARYAELYAALSATRGR